MIQSNSSTVADLKRFDTLLINDRGDCLWRFTDGFDGSLRFKVFATEPKVRTQIKNWEDSVPGADYFIDGKYYATDYIVPKRYLNRIANLLGLDLRKGPSRPRSEKQKAAFEQFRAKRVAVNQGALQFAPVKKVS